MAAMTEMHGNQSRVMACDVAWAHQGRGMMNGKFRYKMRFWERRIVMMLI